MDHHAPHPKAAFEGYYNKFDLPSGGHLVIVICKVRQAETKPNMLSFTYVPRDASKMYQREISPRDLIFRTLEKGSHAFILDIPGIGFAKWDGADSTEYSLKCDEFSFHATTTSRVPWSEESNTPEGMLVNLPLPLHWHVHSLASRCKFEMAIPEYDLPQKDLSGEA